MKEIFQAAEVEAVGMYPLMYEGRVIAVVVSFYPEPRQWSPAEYEVLSAFARQSAVALENARLFEEAERRLSHLQALRAVDVTISASMDLRLSLETLLGQVLMNLEVDAADVLIYNRVLSTLEFMAGRGFRTQALKFTNLRLGEGAAGRAALNRQIIHIPDLDREQESLSQSKLLPKENFVSYHGVPLIAKGELKGVLEIFHRSALDPGPEWLDFLQSLATQAAIAIDNAELFEGLQRSNVELRLAYDATLEGWVRALDLYDKETEGHTRRVTDLTLQLAKALGMSEEEIVHVRRGALLHDIGKMGIPDRILNKPGPLTDEEWEIMRQHPVYAYEMLSQIDYLKPALDIPYHHHEKWDGTGYPLGLKGDEIPLAARIFAVVDVWDALRSDRPYREAWPELKVRAYLQEQSGKHFDPHILSAFLEITAV